MTDLDVRAATPADTDQIKRLALDDHMFQPDEVGDFDLMTAHVGLAAGRRRCDVSWLRRPTL